MTIISKKYLLGIFLSIFLIHNMGLYQTKNIKVGHIVFDKPLFYHFYSLPIEETSIFNKLYQYLGLKTYFKLESKNIILNFENIFYNRLLHISFRTSRSEKKLFQLQYQSDQKSYSTEKNCIYKFTEKSINNELVYEINGIINETNTSFYILGNYTKDVQKAKNSICTK